MFNTKSKINSHVQYQIQKQFTCSKPNPKSIHMFKTKPKINSCSKPNPKSIHMFNTKSKINSHVQNQDQNQFTCSKPNSKSIHVQNQVQNQFMFKTKSKINSCSKPSSKSIHVQNQFMFKTKSKINSHVQYQTQNQFTCSKPNPNRSLTLQEPEQCDKASTKSTDFFGRKKIPKIAAV